MSVKKITILFIVLIVSALISSCTPNVSDETALTEKPSTSSINTEKSSTNYYEELDKLPQKYTSELAEKNGDVVDVHGKSYNIEKLEIFIDAINNKKIPVNDRIRISSRKVSSYANII